jgi:hypothetical protein
MSGQGGDYRKTVRAYQDRVQNLTASSDGSPIARLRIKETRLALAALLVCQEYHVEGLVFAKAESDKPA